MAQQGLNPGSGGGLLEPSNGRPPVLSLKMGSYGFLMWLCLRTWETGKARSYMALSIEILLGKILGE